MYYTIITLTTVGFGDYSIRWYGSLAVFEVIMLVAVCIAGLLVTPGGSTPTANLAAAGAQTHVLGHLHVVITRLLQPSHSNPNSKFKIAQSIAPCPHV